MIYFDYASTSPPLPEVLDEMHRYEKYWYNPSSSYKAGRDAKKLIEEARQRIASSLNCKPEEIFFVSGATEGNNTVLKCFENVWSDGKGHKSVENNINHSQYPDIAVVTPVNNETGETSKFTNLPLPTHVDATQTIGKAHIDISKLPKVKTLTFSGHKIGTLKGIGVLFIRKDFQNKIRPLLKGGSQEKGFRAGTENLPLIMSLAKAVEIANNIENIKKAYLHCSTLKQLMISELSDIPDFKVISPKYSVPHIVAIGFKGIEAESLSLILDSKGMCVGYGSACNSVSIEPSHVLKTMGVAEEYLYGVIRISFSITTTEEDVKSLCDVIHKSLRMVR